MIIGLLVGVMIGLVLGLAIAIAIVTTAGHDWSQVMHQCYIELVYRRYRDEIDGEMNNLG